MGQAIMRSVRRRSRTECFLVCNLVQGDEMADNEYDEAVRGVKTGVDDGALLAAVSQEREIVFRV